MFTRQWWGISCGQAERRSPGGDQVPGSAKQGRAQAWEPVTEGLLGEREKFWNQKWLGCPEQSGHLWGLEAACLLAWEGWGSWGIRESTGKRLWGTPFTFQRLRGCRGRGSSFGIRRSLGATDSLDAFGCWEWRTCSTSEEIRSPTGKGPGVSPSLGPRESLWGPRAWDSDLWDPLNSPAELFAFQGTFCSSGTHPPGWVLWM